MTKLLYLRLACNNLVKNRQTYLPFLVASSLLVFAQYSFLMICNNPGFNQVHGGMQFVTVLQFGVIVVGLFTAIFLFYANSFLIKRRKKELGLYSILGMEKKHIARVVRHELTLSYYISMIVGLALGVLLSRLMFMLIRLLMRIDVPLVGTISWSALLVTVILFALLYLLLMIYNSIQVRVGSPFDLLRGGQTGEREPKARWILAILGLICMLSGYGIAQLVNNPIEAIALFFIAVILVIIGTYLLFLAGSLAVLKLLKSRKNLYYKSQHFISISGMLYRMKQNATGLASIAILCTMAMITIGTTVALYSGSEKMLDEYYPYDIQVTFRGEDDMNAEANSIAALSEQQGVALTECYAIQTYQTLARLENGVFSQIDELESESMGAFNKLASVVLLTPDNYEKLQGQSITVAPGEVAVFGEKPFKAEEAVIGDMRFKARELTADAFVHPVCVSFGSAYTSYALVVPDVETERAIMKIIATEGDAKKAEQPLCLLQCNLDGTQEQKLALGKAFRDALAASDNQSGYCYDKASLRSEWYAMHGGFLFTGVFLGLIFLMGTGLIIYFKQVSEGYQDHDRFIILQKVGMSPEEVKRTVGKQILIVFYLPLLVAICHVAGSVHMISLMLLLFGLTDVPHIALNTFGAALGVAILYGLFYIKTAKTYYKLVKF